MPNHERIVVVAGLCKKYGARIVVDRLSFELCQGEILGLLGPNGAGKTTTASILAGVTRPDAGSVRIAGLDPAVSAREVGRMIGLVPQSIALYPNLSAFENLFYFARMLGLRALAAREAAVQALNETGLLERAHDLVRQFSGGMQRRLNLACGMLHKPAVLLLDEPTVGVDPQSRERIFESIRAAAAAGTAILYSTHYMEEAERLCGRLLLIDGGRIVAEGTAHELIARANGRPRVEMLCRPAPPAGWQVHAPGVKKLEDASAGSEKIQLELDSIEQAPAVLRAVGQTGVEVLEFNLHMPNLQDAFLALTGHELRDPQ